MFSKKSSPRATIGKDGAVGCFKLALGALALAAPLSDVAHADEAGAATDSATAGVRVFGPEFFAEFSPLTALDMALRVPGFRIDDGENVRGFGGAAGNVLIDGERPSSKTEWPGDALARIAASQVERIELLSGPQDGVDMLGQDQVINVVRRAGAEPALNYTLQARRYDSGRVTPIASISGTTKAKGARLEGALAYFSGYQNRSGKETLFDAQGAVQEQSVISNPFWHNGVEVKTSAERKLGDAWTVRLNSRFEHTEFKDMEPRNVFAGGAFDRFEQADYRERYQSRELGGDVERNFSDTLSGKFIALHRGETLWNRSDFVAVAANGDDEGAVQWGKRLYEENIFRLSTSWRPLTKHTIEFGLERAYNALDAVLDLQIDSGGGFEPIALPNGTTHVEEVRYEASVTEAYAPFKRLRLEAGLKVETSRISRRGEEEDERRLTYWKPRLAGTFDVTSSAKASLSLERVAEQLDFDDFASAASLDDDTVDAGNPELVPQRAWELRFTLEKRFWERGALTLTLGRDWADDVQDLAPIGAFEGPANIGEGERGKFDLDLTLPTDRLGVAGGTLQVSADLESTEVTDPVTGEKRQASGEDSHEYSVTWRQDLPRRKFIWGLEAYWLEPQQETVFRVGEISRLDRSGLFSAFARFTDVAGQELTVVAGNLGNQRTDRQRYFFENGRNNPSTGYSDRRREDEFFVQMRLRGTFGAGK